MQEEGVPIFIMVLASAIIVGAFIAGFMVVGVFLLASLGG